MEKKKPTHESLLKTKAAKKESKTGVARTSPSGLMSGESIRTAGPGLMADSGKRVMGGPTKTKGRLGRAMATKSEKKKPSSRQMMY